MAPPSPQSETVDGHTWTEERAAQATCPCVSQRKTGRVPPNSPCGQQGQRNFKEAERNQGKRSDKVSRPHQGHGKRRIPDPKDPSGCGCLPVLLRAPQNRSNLPRAHRQYLAEKSKTRGQQKALSLHPTAPRLLPQARP